MTSEQLLSLARSTENDTDLTYARVDWQAERRAGQTTLDYWQWVGKMRSENADDEPGGSKRPMVLNIGGAEAQVMARQVR